MRTRYGLSWNSNKAGRLLSGSNDARLCIWDVEATHADKSAVRPLATFQGHTAAVQVRPSSTHVVVARACGGCSSTVVLDADVDRS